MSADTAQAWEMIRNPDIYSDYELVDCIRSLLDDIEEQANRIVSLEARLAQNGNLQADIEERDRELDAEKMHSSLRFDEMNELRAQLAQAREALRVIATQSLYEWGEKRDSLCSIIDAQRKVAQAALAQGGEEQR